MLSGSCCAQLVSNDRLEILNEEQPSRALAGSTKTSIVDRRSALISRRRRESLRPEGRWFVLSWGRPDPEPQAIAQATLLLDRYGVAARELALLDRTMLPWRILYEVLSRMELAGDVRRGYFAEGMSGAQFARVEAIRMMQDLEPASTVAHPSILLHSLDPANLYGSVPRLTCACSMPAPGLGRAGPVPGWCFAPAGPCCSSNNEASG